MKRRITEEEFRELMEPWDPRMKAIVEQRLTTGFHREALENFTEEEAQIMRAVVERLIPQSEDVDIVGFIDGRMWDALGRGDRQPGMPEETEVFHRGIQGLEEAAVALHGHPFVDLDGDKQDEVLRKVQSGEAPGSAWERVPGPYFFQRFYGRALTGYFAHPRAWMRIGFYGPSYPEGYAWIHKGQVKQRHERAMGWERL